LEEGVNPPQKGLRQYGLKTRCFCPSESKATRIKASLSSPSERNRARSAFLTVFSPYSLRQARDKKKAIGSIFASVSKSVMEKVFGNAYLLFLLFD